MNSRKYKRAYVFGSKLFQVRNTLSLGVLILVKLPFLFSSLRVELKCVSNIKALREYQCILDQERELSFYFNLYTMEGKGEKRWQ